MSQTLDKTSVYSEYVIVTPEKAASLLQCNTGNRPLSNATVLFYSKQMADGKWHPETDESIKLSISGSLIDGQHRLHSIIKAGVNLRMKITYNLPEDAFKYIDQGKKRSASDVLSIAGVINASTVAGIIKSHDALTKGNSIDRGGNKTLSNEDIYLIYQHRPKFWDEVATKAGRIYQSLNKTAPPSFIGAHYAIFCGIDHDDADIFFERVGTGLGIMSVYDPCKLLRDYFMKQLDVKTKVKNTVQYSGALTIKAWNLFRTKKEIKHLRWTPLQEEYPIPR
jgi:hypothetical protein